MIMINVTVSRVCTWICIEIRNVLSVYAIDVLPFVPGLDNVKFLDEAYAS